MLAGYLYDCGDTELLSQCHRAKGLIGDYNQTDSANTAEKEHILNELLGGRGKICGLLLLFMLIMETIFISEKTVK